MAGACDYGNEPLGSTKWGSDNLLACQEGHCSMELILFTQLVI